MARILADRISESTTTAGTGPFVLLGPQAGFRAFAAVCANGDTVPYCATGSAGNEFGAGAEWEVGIATFSTAGPTLTRATVIASSNANAAVNFAAGTKQVFLAAPANHSFVRKDGDAMTGGLAIQTPTGNPFVSLFAPANAFPTLLLRVSGVGGYQAFADSANGGALTFQRTDVSANPVSGYPLVLDDGGGVRVVTPALSNSSTLVATTAFVKGQNYATLTAPAFASRVRIAEVALADAATIATDAAAGNAFRVTLAGNRTLANPGNLAAGTHLLWKVQQDGTGARTLAFGAAFKFPSGQAPVMTTTPNAVDIIAGYSDGTSVFANIVRDVR